MEQKLYWHKAQLCNIHKTMFKSVHKQLCNSMYNERSKVWGQYDFFFCSPGLHLFNQKYSKNSNIVKYYYSLNSCCLFKKKKYSCAGKSEASAGITPVMILQKSF